MRGTIETLASELAKAGVNIEREQPAVAGFRGVLAPLYADAAVVSQRQLPARILRRRAVAAAATLPASNNSLQAERLRGIALSHRDWVIASVGRTRLRAQWRELFKTFDAVICPIMATPAYPHDHSPDQEQRRIPIDGKARLYRPVAWPGIATLPGLPRPRSRPALHPTDCRSACRSSAPGWRTARR